VISFCLCVQAYRPLLPSSYITYFSSSEKQRNKLAQVPQKLRKYISTVRSVSGAVSWVRLHLPLGWSWRGKGGGLTNSRSGQIVGQWVWFDNFQCHCNLPVWILLGLVWF